MKLFIMALALVLLGVVAFVPLEADAQVPALNTGSITVVCTGTDAFTFTCDSDGGNAVLSGYVEDAFGVARPQLRLNGESGMFFDSGTTPRTINSPFFLFPRNFAGAHSSFEIGRNPNAVTSAYNDAVTAGTASRPSEYHDGTRDDLFIFRGNLLRSNGNSLVDNFIMPIRVVISEVNSPPTLHFTDTGTRVTDPDGRAVIDLELDSFNMLQDFTLPVDVIDTDRIHASGSNPPTFTTQTISFSYKTDSAKFSPVSASPPAFVDFDGVTTDDDSVTLTNIGAGLLNMTLIATDGTPVEYNIQFNIANPPARPSVLNLIETDASKCVGYTATGTSCNVIGETRAMTHHKEDISATLRFNTDVGGFDASDLRLSIIDSNMENVTGDYPIMDFVPLAGTSNEFSFTIPAPAGVHLEYTLGVGTDFTSDTTDQSVTGLEGDDRVKFVIDTIKPILTHDVFLPTGQRDSTAYTGPPFDRAMCLTEAGGCDVPQSPDTVNYFESAGNKIIDPQNSAYTHSATPEEFSIFVTSEPGAGDTTFTTETVGTVSFIHDRSSSDTDADVQDMAGNMPEAASYTFNVIDVIMYELVLQNSTGHTIQSASLQNGPVTGKITFDDDVTGFDSADIKVSTSSVDNVRLQFTTDSQSVYTFTIPATSGSYTIAIDMASVRGVAGQSAFPVMFDSSVRIDADKPEFRHMGDKIPAPDGGLATVTYPQTASNTYMASDFSLVDTTDTSYAGTVTITPITRATGDPITTVDPHPDRVLLTGTADAAGNLPDPLIVRIIKQDNTAPVITSRIPASLMIDYGVNPSLDISYTDGSLSGTQMYTCSQENKLPGPLRTLECEISDAAGNTLDISIPVTYTQFNFTGHPISPDNRNVGGNIVEGEFTITNLPVNLDLTYTITGDAREDWASINATHVKYDIPRGIGSVVPGVGNLHAPFNFTMTVALADDPTISASFKTLIRVAFSPPSDLALINSDLFTAAAFSSGNNRISYSTTIIPIFPNEMKTVDVLSHFENSTNLRIVLYSAADNNERACAYSMLNDPSVSEANRDFCLTFTTNGSDVTYNSPATFMGTHDVRFCIAPSGTDCDVNTHNGVVKFEHTAIKPTITLVDANDKPVGVDGDGNAVTTFHNSMIRGVIDFAVPVPNYPIGSIIYTRGCTAPPITSGTPCDDVVAYDVTNLMASDDSSEYTFEIAANPETFITYTDFKAEAFSFGSGSTEDSDLIAFTIDTIPPKYTFVVSGLTDLIEDPTTSAITVNLTRSDMFEDHLATVDDPDGGIDDDSMFTGAFDTSTFGVLNDRLIGGPITFDTIFDGIRDLAGNAATPRALTVTLQDIQDPVVTIDNRPIIRIGSDPRFTYTLIDNDNILDMAGTCREKFSLPVPRMITCTITDRSGNNDTVTSGPSGFEFNQLVNLQSSYTVNEGVESMTGLISPLVNSAFRLLSSPTDLLYDITVQMTNEPRPEWITIVPVNNYQFRLEFNPGYDIVTSGNSETFNLTLNATLNDSGDNPPFGSAIVNFNIVVNNRNNLVDASTVMDEIVLPVPLDVTRTVPLSDQFEVRNSIHVLYFRSIEGYRSHDRSGTFVDIDRGTVAISGIDYPQTAFNSFLSIGASGSTINLNIINTDFTTSGGLPLNSLVLNMCLDDPSSGDFANDCDGNNDVRFTIPVTVTRDYTPIERADGTIVNTITIDEGATQSPALSTFFKNSDLLQFSLEDNPDFVTIGSTSLAINPGIYDSGEHSFNIVASDGGSDRDFDTTIGNNIMRQNYTVTVNHIDQGLQVPRLQINNVNTISFLAPGQTYNFDLTGNDVIDGYTCSVNDNINNALDALTNDADCATVPRYSGDVRFILDPDLYDTNDESIRVEITLAGNLVHNATYTGENATLSFSIPEEGTLEFAGILNNPSLVLKIIDASDTSVSLSRTYVLDILSPSIYEKVTDPTLVAVTDIITIESVPSNLQFNIGVVAVSFGDISVVDNAPEPVMYNFTYYDSPIGLASYIAGTDSLADPNIRFINGERINFLRGVVNIAVEGDPKCPCTVTFNYTSDPLIPDNELRIVHFDTTQNRWEYLPTTVDIVNKQISAVTDSFSPYGLAGAPEPRASTSSPGKGDDEDWRKKPTFGTSWEVQSSQLVKSGFVFNDYTLDITDNWHTDFEKTSSIIGDINHADIKVFAPDGLRTVSLVLGIPEIGDTANAESTLDIMLERDYSRDTGYMVSDIIHSQSETLINPDLTTVDITKSHCNKSQGAKFCYTISIDFSINAPLSYDVIALQAIDEQRRSTVTYLNHGIEFTGESLLAPATATIYLKDSNQDDTTIINLAQIDRRFPVYEDQFGDSWHVNSFGTWNRLTVSDVQRQTDSYSAVMTRHNSNFEQIINHEYNKALKLFDSGAIQGHLDDTHTIHFGGEERIDGDLLDRMKISEERALDILRLYGYDFSGQ